MSFSLPDLPYAHDALAPYMSKETLEYHHDKHHKAYVDNGNKLLEGSGLEGKSLEEIVRSTLIKTLKKSVIQVKLKILLVLVCRSWAIAILRRIGRRGRPGSCSRDWS